MHAGGGTSTADNTFQPIAISNISDNIWSQSERCNHALMPHVWGDLRVERISRHIINNQQIDGCKPISLNIGVYIDGFAAKKSAEVLYEEGDRELYEHLRREASGDVELHKQLYNRIHTPPTAETYADIISFCLALVELHVVAVMEDRYRAAGTPVRPNALLVNQSNPIWIDLESGRHNLLEALFPVSEQEWQAAHYLDVVCNGTIYSPAKIEREHQNRVLRQELADAERIGDRSRVEWIKHNIKTLPDGIIHYRRRDGSIGGPVDFDATERFYDAVANQVGYFSRRGATKVHWRNDLSDFGEKGVDCDLIMQVMDDLHGGDVDAFVLMTNDMDFFPLVERIQLERKAVFLCGLHGSVSKRLISSAGRDAFFDLASRPVLSNLPSVFMTAKDPAKRAMALQWAYLALMQERREGR